MMKVISLQSGSNGNCIYVEAAGRRLLFDAGISGKQAQLRLASRGVDIRSVEAVIISHDHSDHIRCAGIYQRKFGLPVYATARTLQAARTCSQLGELADVRHFAPGQTLAFGDLAVQTIHTPHDAVEGVAFIIADGRARLGILTDLGHVFDGLADLIASLDAVLLESNYDAEMLRDGPYPPMLKRRIAGPGGHLSNVESARLLRLAAGGRMKWACLAHLSEQNNCPAVAMRTHRSIIRPTLPLAVASRYEPSEWMTV
ncbi:MAG: MBL fold metallo-hydrolase [Phycisphaerae bacterium]